MYSTDSRPTRILAQQGIDYLETLESELERPIIITTGGLGGGSGSAEARAQLAREKYPDAEDPLVIVFEGSITATDWNWWYTSRIDSELVHDPNGGRYMSTTEFRTWDPANYPGIDAIGLTLPFDEVERVVFEVQPNLVACTLRFAGNAIDYGPTYENYNWERILGDPLRLAVSPDIEAQHAEMLATRDQRAFETFVTTTRDRALRGIRNRIRENEQNVQSYQTGLTDSLRQLSVDNKQIVALEASLDEPDVWRRRFDELVNHPKLTSVKFSNNSFILETDHLRMENPDDGESRWIGRFQITVPLQGGYSIGFHNLDNPKGGRPHPHVAEDGPCFGAISSTVAKLLADFELMALTDMLLMFLETFNPKDDWGSYASYWFGVEDEDPRNIGDEFAPVDELEMAVA